MSAGEAGSGAPRRRPPGTAVALTLLALLLAVSAGVGLGAVLFHDTTPPSLRTAAPVASVPTSVREFADKRAVELGFTLAADGALTSPESGRVTGFDCVPGGTLVSGEPALAIDGRRVLGFSTSVPLWRDLSWGDDGEDVRALRAELARLGLEVEGEGAVDRSVYLAIAELFEKAGEAEYSNDVIPLDRLIWLPAPSTQVKECLVSTGSSVNSGEKLAVVPGGLVSARVVRLPDRLTPGDRMLVVDGEQIPSDAEGRLSDPDALAALATTPSFFAAVSTSTPTVTASWELEAPIEVNVVPPAALYDLDGGSACVASGGEPFAVTVLGSELGQSFVVFDTETTPKHVDFSPEQPRSCR